MTRSHLSELLWLLVTTAVLVSDVLWGRSGFLQEEASASALEEGPPGMFNDSAPRNHIPLNISDFLS